MKLNVEIKEVENGYIVREGETRLTSGYLPGKMWVAKDVKDLQELIGALAVECVHFPPVSCDHVNTKIWEPHLARARKCIDCGAVYNPNRTPNWQHE